MTILITSFIVFFLLTDLQKCWSFSLNNLNSTLLGRNGKPVNILLILADDLGYGDTSVAPFIGSGILTPNLQKMASRGAVLTNFHASATTCTPSRAAILTGMYPWRLGIKAVFEYGAKTHNRDDWLLQVPTVPMIFSEASYNTFHSGKWHLGGMRNDDFDMRTLAAKPLGTKGGKRCPHPGPNQQGFQNYVSVLDGPGSPRQNHLQIEDKLYSEGCQHLLHNDKPITPEMFNITGYLSYCEAQHAMRAMTNSVKESKPFYVHLWFHAPHGVSIFLFFYLWQKKLILILFFRLHFYEISHGKKSPDMVIYTMIYNIRKILPKPLIVMQGKNRIHDKHDIVL